MSNSPKNSRRQFLRNTTLAALLDEKIVYTEKYKAIWKPRNDLAKGVYWVTLKVNDLQVHYLKVVKL